MAEADFTELDLSLDTASVLKGVTHGIARPNGGGNFVHGFNSIVTTPGVAGYFLNGSGNAGFAPMAKGMTIRSCIQRGISGGPLNFAPFVYAEATGHTVADSAYLLGLEDAEPHHIVFRKGVLTGGLPAANVGTQGIWKKSTATYPPGTWLHLRMDVIAEPNGDVLIQFFQSDLVANPYQTPVWTAIPGMNEFLDDVLQVATGSAPLTSGYAGFAQESKDVARRSYFKQIEMFRQT